MVFASTKETDFEDENTVSNEGKDGDEKNKIPEFKLESITQDLLKTTTAMKKCIYWQLRLQFNETVIKPIRPNKLSDMKFIQKQVILSNCGILHQAPSKKNGR